MSKKTLYIYDEDKFDNLTEELSNYEFYDIAYFIDLYATIEALKAVNKDEYTNIVVDISDLIHESGNNKLYIATYIRTLSKFENIVFCIRSSLYDSFKSKFPVLHLQLNKNYDFQEQYIESTGEPLVITKKLCVYTYYDFSKTGIDNKCVLTLSELIDDWNQLSIRYNIDTIKQTISEQEIEYIDLSSTLKTLRIRNDLILQFEIFIHNIARRTEIKFCVESSLLEDLSCVSPFIFEEHKDLDEKEILENDERKEKIDILSVEKQLNEICQKLIGHDTFKCDFKNAFLKHKFLSQMGERNILSIILCGDSGIGKTEFAKITSKVLYPEEQLIKINFGNYSTEGVLNSLIGSPLGYVGSDEGGELINKIKNSKSKIILIDEFEKATPSVYNFFYELLEDGVFTDRHGRAYDLSGYIIIFTSNMSEKQYKKHIPDSLKSRFDMVYCFVDIPIEEKMTFISDTAKKLVEKLNSEFKVEIDINKLQTKLYELANLQNLRDMKRKVEDIVFLEFFELYRKSIDD